MNLNKRVGITLRALRKEMKLKRGKKMNQQELAKKLGMIQSALSRVESGFQNLTPEQLYKASKVFHVPLERFFEKIL